MDALLEIIAKYKCDLKRDNESISDFLRKNFDNYLYDLTNAIKRKDNEVVTDDMNKMVEKIIPEISDNANEIVDILKLYEKGLLIPSSTKAFSLFEKMKPQLMIRYLFKEESNRYYRIRKYYDDNPFPLERKELFHIPISKNYLVGPERYSMPGHPCLYLASQPELAWQECDKPNKYAIAKFKFITNHDLKFIDFSAHLVPLSVDFFCWLMNGKDRDKVFEYLLKNLYSYPLRAACSVQVKHKSGKFKEEYIISQFLLQWIRTDQDFDGVKYISCSNDPEVRYYGGHNIVLVTKEFDSEGFDINLRKNINIGKPEIFDIEIIKNDTNIIKLANGDDPLTNPFLWHMSQISDDYKTI